MIVADASAAVNALLHDGDARRLFLAEAIGVPHLADAEVTNALRGRIRHALLEPDTAFTALATWMTLGVRRFPVYGLLSRVWELRENLSAYDATYVALAESLQAELCTADARLAAAPGPTCRVTVVKS